MAQYDKQKARSREGLVTRIYNNQRMTSRKMGRPLPAYSKKNLLSWMLTHPDFEKLFDAWVTSDYDKNLSPSIDRLDNTKSYELSNIQLTTWRQNLLNQKSMNKDCSYLHTGSKAVLCISLDGVKVTRFDSIGSALRSLGIQNGVVSNISSVANGKWLSAYGYKWEWALS